MRTTRMVWNPATARFVRANEQLEQDEAVTAGEGDEAVQVKPPKFPNLIGRLIGIAQPAAHAVGDVCGARAVGVAMRSGY